MSKIKQFLIPGITSLMLVLVLSFISIHSFSTPVLAATCSIGSCECECIGPCGGFFFRVPYSPVDVYGCQCADGSESCQGIYY